MLLGICLHQAPRPSFLAIAALEIHRAIFSDRGDYVHSVKWIVNFLHTNPWGKLLLPNGIGVQLGHDVINDRGADVRDIPAISIPNSAASAICFSLGALRSSLPQKPFSSSSWTFA